MLKKGVGRNSLNVYLSFDGFFRRIFSLTGERDSMELG